MLNHHGILSLVFLAILFRIGNASPVVEGKDAGEIKEYLKKVVVTNPGTYSFIVHIDIEVPFESEGKRFYEISSCGGVIIKTDVILTAAHCVADDEPDKSIWVWAGILDTEIEEGRGQKILVKKYLTHENYAVRIRNIYSPNDIALLWLEKPLTLRTNRITLATLPQKEFEYENRYGWIAGWGLTACGEKSAMLQKAFMKALERSECNRYYEKSTISDKTICVMSDDKKSANNYGDSGGPFVVNGVVVGISSFGTELKIKDKHGKDISICSPRKPGVYTDVSKYIGWINRNMNLYSKKSAPINLPPLPPRRSPRPTSLPPSPPRSMLLTTPSPNIRRIQVSSSKNTKII